MQMILLDMVISEDEGKTLRMLGVPQGKTMFVWAEDGILHKKDKNSWGLRVAHGSPNEVDAHTLSELGKILPQPFASGRDNGKDYCMFDSGSQEYQSDGDTEVSARCQMVINLIKTKVIAFRKLDKGEKEIISNGN